MLFAALERKISVRANRDELVQKGILLPESPITPVPEASKCNIHLRNAMNSNNVYNKLFSFSFFSIKWMFILSPITKFP